MKIKWSCTSIGRNKFLTSSSCQLSVAGLTFTEKNRTILLVRLLIYLIALVVAKEVLVAGIRRIIGRYDEIGLLLTTLAVTIYSLAVIWISALVFNVRALLNIA